MLEISLPIKDRNLCVKLLGKSEKVFHNNFNVKRVTVNRKFWQIIKPNFIDGDKVVIEEKDAVKKFKDHFEKIVETLKIDRPILSDFK